MSHVTNALGERDWLQGRGRLPVQRGEEIATQVAPSTGEAVLVQVESGELEVAGPELALVRLLMQYSLQCAAKRSPLNSEASLSLSS